MLEEETKATLFLENSTSQLDRRVLPDEDVQETYNEIVEFIESKSKELGLSYKVVVEDIENSYVMQGDKTIVSTISQITESITGVQPRVGVKTGFTEMALFGAKGIKGLTFGPGDENLAHVANEYIEIQQLINSVKIFSTFLLRI